MAKKQKKGLRDKIGIWSFFIGFIIVFGVTIISPVGLTDTWAATLAVLGAIVGLLNIADREATTYLVSSIAFIVAAWAFMSTIGAWTLTKTFMHALIVFVAPGALLVSLKVMIGVAKD